MLRVVAIYELAWTITVIGACSLIDTSQLEWILLICSSIFSTFVGVLGLLEFVLLHSREKYRRTANYSARSMIPGLICATFASSIVHVIISVVGFRTAFVATVVTFIVLHFVGLIASLLMSSDEAKAS